MGGRGAAALPIGIPSYKDDLGGVPNVCIKVPTGGGKTFLAASVKTIFDRLPTGKSKFVVWLVPSDAILTQTIANLSKSDHPYRQRLNQDFGGAVNVYTKEQLLNAQNFQATNVMENLSIAVLCYASIRANPTKKDDKKIYQENGNLLAFSEFFNARELLLADTPRGLDRFATAGGCLWYNRLRQLRWPGCFAARLSPRPACHEELTTDNTNRLERQ
ncbi:MAG: DEAD/DEAH box helicase family protein [Kiritimatiellia bacterium]